MAGRVRSRGARPSTSAPAQIHSHVPGELIVDLTGCGFLDSTGLRALIATRARLGRSNRRLALVLSNPSVLRIFQITRFDQLFEIYPSLRAAINRDGSGNGDGHG